MAVYLGEKGAGGRGQVGKGVSINGGVGGRRGGRGGESK